MSLSENRDCVKEIISDLPAHQDWIMLLRDGLLTRNHGEAAMTCNQEKNERPQDIRSRLECIDPEHGQTLLTDYFTKSLCEDRLARFERHRQACRYCEVAIAKFNKACRILAEEYAALFESNEQENRQIE